MLREHAPLIAVAAVIAVVFYFVFRDVRSLRADVEVLSSQLMLADATDMPALAEEAEQATTPAQHPSAGPAHQAHQRPSSRQRQAALSSVEPTSAVTETPKPAAKRA